MKTLRSIAARTSERSSEITRPNQVWAMDINIPMSRGFVYLAVVLDWFSLAHVLLLDPISGNDARALDPAKCR